MCNLFSMYVGAWLIQVIAHNWTHSAQHIDINNGWSINTPLLCILITKFRTILEKNKCDKCNVTIHPNFIGNHKCDHQNCPICKSPIPPSQYWFHIRTHPGHENDSHPSPKERTYENRGNTNQSGHSGYGSYRRD